MAIAIATVGSVAYAAQGGMGNNAMAITKAKIPLAQAVTTAEQHAKGKAVRAEYEHSKHGWVYDVEIVSGTKEFDVKINADKGAAISYAEDRLAVNSHESVSKPTTEESSPVESSSSLHF